MNAEALFLILVLALLGGIGGGAAVLGVDAVVRRIARRRGIQVPPRGGETQSGSGNGGKLESIQAELFSLRTAMNRMVQQVSDISHTLRMEERPAAGAASSSGARGSNPGASDLPKRDQIARRPAAPEGSGEAHASYRPPSAPPRELGARREGSAGAPRIGRRRPREIRGKTEPRADWIEEIDHRLSEQTAVDGLERRAASAFDLSVPTPPDGPAQTPVTPRPPAGPPPNAVNVEARDDRIVASSSYPPEAWLEPRGPAVAHLWLNPSVALNENALRRLSTFFEWRGERAGATYDTDQPAVLRWDEGQRVGTINVRGIARPR